MISRDLVRSLGVGRFLEWGVVNAKGVGGGVLVFLGELNFGDAGNGSW